MVRNSFENKILHIFGDYKKLTSLRPNQKNKYYNIFQNLNEGKTQNYLMQIAIDLNRIFFLNTETKAKECLCPDALKDAIADDKSKFLNTFISDVDTPHLNLEKPITKNNATNDELRNYFLKKLLRSNAIKNYKQGDFCGGTFLGFVFSEVIPKTAELSAEDHVTERFIYKGNNQNLYGFTLEYSQKNPSFWALGITRHPIDSNTPTQFDYFFSPTLHNHSNFSDMKHLLIENIKLASGESSKNHQDLSYQYLPEPRYEALVQEIIDSRHCYDLYQRYYKKIISPLSLKLYILAIFIALFFDAIFFALAYYKVGGAQKAFTCGFSIIWQQSIVLLSVFLAMLLILAVNNYCKFNRFEKVAPNELKKLLVAPYTHHPSASLILITCILALGIFTSITLGTIIIIDEKLFPFLSVKDGIGILSTTVLFALISLLVFYNYQCHRFFKDYPGEICHTETKENNHPNLQTSI
jgi:hypothetical protein